MCGASFSLIPAEGPGWEGFTTVGFAPPPLRPPTHECAQGTETLLITALGPAGLSESRGRRPQKDAPSELQRQSHLLPSFMDHLSSTCCVNGTGSLWDKLEDGFRHDWGGSCGGLRLGVPVLAPLLNGPVM